MNAKQTEGSRRRRSRAEVGQLVSEYDRSGLSKQEFCGKYGLSLSTLSRHRKRAQLQAEDAPSGRLIPVRISPRKQGQGSERGGELLVWVAGGRRIEVRAGFDAQVLRQLVRLLEQA